MGWVIDILGAALFAAGIAGGIGRLADGQVIGWLPPTLILAGGMLRGAGLLLAHVQAIRTAQADVALRRSSLIPRLLGGRLTRPLLAGENAMFAIDHMTAIEAYGARFMPARRAAMIGPLLVAAIVAGASWVAATILLATLVPFAFGMMLAGTAARRAAEQQMAALAQLSGLFVDRLRALPLIRHFDAQARVIRQVDGAAQAVATRTSAVLRIAFLSGAVMEFFAALSVALVAVYCGFALLGLLPFPMPETLNLKQALFALAMAPEFYLPMRRLAAAYHEKQLGEAAEGALQAVLPADDATPLSTPGAFDGLRVDALCIGLGAGIGPVTLNLEMADLVALTGPTGSGKTSMLAAIAGQIQPVQGRVTTAGGDVIDPDQIAWASQTPLFLPGSLADNIALARPDADRTDIARVAGLVGLTPMLHARSAGLDLIIDHAGSGLSGGERRRIGLARAILSNRPLLLCDEPTADLDADSAAAITALLVALSASHAILVATHDPHLTAAARQVVAL
ncbi:ATP-binding cassette domain-containing protein [Sphingobium sp. AP49]|uniref:ATP-binding cassette domain-containing protein n=1 Tax=Sphingobium sp. AP49 TaxID=1144307 RepID=UPI00026ECF20|nr:ATP-binding cassette domain-containing protein [Sphingobium sp. AP49]WHO37937.1 ATP-binding cassette domain-containing protein [Sphingobium sp. AP49]